MMRAGDLRHLVRIEAPIETQDEYGEPLVTWQEFAEVYAGKRDLTGREWFAAQTTTSTVTTCFQVRYLDGITAKMRLTDSGQVYDIEYPQDPDGRSRKLYLYCSKVV